MSIIIQNRNHIIKPPPCSVPKMGHPLARGLVACFLMNEAGGLIVRNSIKGGVDAVLNSVTWANKQKGPSLVFSGSPNYVDLGNPDSLNFGDGVPYSFEWIFKMGSAGVSNQQLTSKDIVTGNQRIHFFVNGGVLIRWTDLNGPTVGTSWIHVVYTYSPSNTANNGTETFYADGRQVSTRTGSMPAWQSGPSYALGRSIFGGGGVFHFIGDVALMRIYRVTLTPVEIQALYINPYAPFENGPRYYPPEGAPVVVPSCDSWLPLTNQPRNEPTKVIAY